MAGGPTDEDIILALEDMGLEREEADIYRALLAKGVASVGEISRSFDYSRSKIYSIFDRLMAKGWVKVVSETPKVFAPVNPESVLELKRKTVAKAYKTALDALGPVYRSLPVKVPGISILRGVEAFRRIEDMIGSASREVKVVSTVIPTRTLDRLTESLLLRKKAGLVVKAILPAGTPLTRSLKEIGARVMNVPSAGMVIVDDSQVYIGSVTAGDGDPGEIVGVWTENPAMVTFNNMLFDTLYSVNMGGEECIADGEGGN